METVDRYINEVLERLPHSQRESVRVELEELIEGKLRQRSQDENQLEESIEEFLKQLGPPTLLAKKYKKSNKYLISPDIFSSYAFVLKVVLLVLFSVLTVIFFIQTLIEPFSIIGHFFNYISSLISGGLQAFALVTIIFFLLETKFKGVGSEVKKSFDASKKKHGVTKSNVPKNRVKKGEPIASVIFSILFTILLLFGSHLIGVPVIGTDVVSFIPVLNLDDLPNYLPLLLVLIGLGVIKEILKLTIGKWTNQLAIFSALINIFSFVIVTIVITSPSFWNPNFLSELTQLGLFNASGDIILVISFIWNHISFIILFFYFIGTIGDTITGFYKANRRSRFRN
ncbi:hypothetical protein [Alkalihalobacterium elongatum]|uniref:hypothetical protein n=1 Tax=Alkalihalobacterium elongatum TaxID=2675466 RepID=UPI001C1FE352|nr:hypothetical protein [Alkalihalobacterium elongatum]